MRDWKENTAIFLDVGNVIERRCGPGVFWIFFFFSFWHLKNWICMLWM